MADPEQIYQEVLTEEQGKGVSPAVAEGRAKAARSRAEQGSPHPKEPKWWPGAQPHLEGDGAAPPAEGEAEPAAEEAAEEAPAAAAEEVEAPAAEQPADAPAAPEAPAATEEAPAAIEEAPAPQEQAPAAAEAPPQPAEPTAAPAAAAAAAEAVERPSGVTHGTVAGTRVRPEDSVTTEAQFEGQKSMYDRRRLIDELIASGVPATAAGEAGGRRSPMLAILYLLIPILAIAIVLAQNDAAGGGGEGAAPKEESGVSISAANVAFDKDEITIPADEATTVAFTNEDSVAHNFSIYTDDSATEDLFVGQNVDGGGQVDYDVPALEAGEYFFRCDLHPSAMTGTAIVE